MNLLLLTQYYPPEMGAAPARLSDLASRFVKQGHRVTVLTALPNYPTGKIFPGYGGLFRREPRDSVQVVRAFIYPTQTASFVPRLTNYFSFVLSSTIVGSALPERVDYVMVESPPLFLGLSAFWLSRLKKARLIFNVSDLWPESAASMGLLRTDSLAYGISSWLEAFLYKKAWLVSGQSRSIMSNIMARFPDRPTFHLSNGVDVKRYGPELRNSEIRNTLARDGECAVLYAGLFGLAQGLDQVVEAAAAVRTEGGYRFTLMGEGPEKKTVVAMGNDAGLTNLQFIDGRPAPEIPVWLASADIILVPLKLYIPGAVPSKLYEAMASGKPLVLIARGEAADIVRTHNVGLVVQPGDVSGLTDALRRLRNDQALREQLSANGRRAAEKYFDREKISQRFIDHLEMGLTE